MGNLEDNSVTFQATLGKISTLVDGGVRITLDLPESAGEILSELASLRGVALQVALVQSE